MQSMILDQRGPRLNPLKNWFILHFPLQPRKLEFGQPVQKTGCYAPWVGRGALWKNSLYPSLLCKERTGSRARSSQPRIKASDPIVGPSDKGRTWGRCTAQALKWVTTQPKPQGISQVSSIVTLRPLRPRATFLLFSLSVQRLLCGLAGIFVGWMNEWMNVSDIKEKIFKTPWSKWS